MQVKTAFLDSERDRYSFNLSYVEKGDNITYVFVLVESAGNYNFLVMSPKDVQKEIKKGSIYFNKSTKRYRVIMYLRKGRLSVGTLGNDRTEELGDWSLFGGEGGRRNGSTWREGDGVNKKRGRMA